jgi:hypothetical protein
MLICFSGCVDKQKQQENNILQMIEKIKTNQVDFKKNQVDFKKNIQEIDSLVDVLSKEHDTIYQRRKYNSEHWNPNFR